MYRSRILATLSILAVGLASASSASADQPSTPVTTNSLKLKLSGTLFGSFSVDVSKANDAPNPTGAVTGANRFDLTRAYINIEPQITESISLRITPDLTRVSGTGGTVDGSLALRLKYAYANFANLPGSTTLRAGMMQTPYIEFEDNVWKYRVLGTSGIEFFRGMPSADLGAGLRGTHLEGILDWSVAVLNGEGYSKPEKPANLRDAKYKAIGGRLTVTPFKTGDNEALKGLKLTGFYQYEFTRGAVTADGVEPLAASRLMALASYERPLGTIAIGYGAFSDDAEPVAPATSTSSIGSNLITAFGFLNLPYNLRLLARFDSFDANTSKSVAEDPTAGSRTRTIAGVAYRISDTVQVIGDWQHFGWSDADEQALSSDVGDQLFVHLEANF